MTALLAATPAVGQSAILDLSTPQTGSSKYVFDENGKPVQLGVALVDPQASYLSDGGTAPDPSCGGKNYGDISCLTARPKTVHVDGYWSKRWDVRRQSPSKRAGEEGLALNAPQNVRRPSVPSEAMTSGARGGNA
jgi:hypothetical protein